MEFEKQIKKMADGAKLTGDACKFSELVSIISDLVYTGLNKRKMARTSEGAQDSLKMLEKNEGPSARLRIRWELRSRRSTTGRKPTRYAWTRCVRWHMSLDAKPCSKAMASESRLKGKKKNQRDAVKRKERQRDGKAGSWRKSLQRHSRRLHIPQLSHPCTV